MTRYLMTIVCMFSVWTCAHEANKPRISIGDYEYEEPPLENVRISYYEPVAEQCQGNPLITASSAKIDTIALRNGEIRWVAVSRDLEDRFRFGDSIEIFISEGHKWNGNYLVNDRTSKRLTKTVDILSNTFKGGCYQGQITKVL